MTQLCVFVSDVTKETRGRNKKTEFPQKSKLTSKTSVCMERGGTLGRLSGPGPRPPRPPRTRPPPRERKGRSDFPCGQGLSPVRCQEWCQQAK